MTIAIDCRMLHGSGVGVYLKGCLPFFLSSEHDFFLFGNPSSLSIYSDRANVKIIDCSIKPFSIKELLFFPNKITKHINMADVFYTPFFNIPYGIKIPVFTTIHDIAFPDMPELVSKIGLAARMYFYKRAFKYSKKIFTVSLFSKSRIEHWMEYYSCKKPPVIVTYSAIQPQLLTFRQSNKNIHKKNIILFIGNIKKHKGLNCLIEAFLLAKTKGLAHRLIVVGEMKKFRSADEAVIGRICSLDQNSVFFTGHITNEELIEYLSTADLLVQPSLYEGFCLPPLEALALGTNALISDITVLKEIYEDFPVTFFQAGNAVDLKEKMMEILSKKSPSPILSNELKNKYTFEKTASLILRELE